MSEPNSPEGLPQEYTEAYRRGYERALAEARRDAGEQPSVASDDEPTVAVPVAGGAEDTTVLPSLAGAFRDDPAPQTRRSSFEDLMDAASREESEPAAYDNRPAAAYDEPDRGRPRWLVAVLLVALVVVLLVAAFGIGRLVSSALGGHHAAAPHLSTGGAQGGRHRSAYTGPVRAAQISGASACQAPDAVDAAGHPVSYPPGAVHDGDMSTAWRCDGNGVGQRLKLGPRRARCGSGTVGLIAGYAKTDPADGTDRYAQNDRLTKVRWTFDDGSSGGCSRLDGGPHPPGDAAGSGFRRPRTRTVDDRPSSAPPAGPMNTVAVSEGALGAVAH